MPLNRDAPRSRNDVEQRYVGSRDGVPVYEVTWPIRPRDLDTLVLRPTLDGSSAFRWKVGQTEILAETVTNHALAEGILKE